MDKDKADDGERSHAQPPTNQPQTQSAREDNSEPDVTPGQAVADDWPTIGLLYVDPRAAGQLAPREAASIRPLIDVSQRDGQAAWRELWSSWTSPCPQGQGGDPPSNTLPMSTLANSEDLGPNSSALTDSWSRLLASGFLSAEPASRTLDVGMALNLPFYPLEWPVQRDGSLAGEKPAQSHTSTDQTNGLLEASKNVTGEHIHSGQAPTRPQSLPDLTGHGKKREAVPGGVRGLLPNYGYFGSSPDISTRVRSPARSPPADYEPSETELAALEVAINENRAAAARRPSAAVSVGWKLTNQVWPPKQSARISELDPQAISRKFFIGGLPTNPNIKAIDIVRQHLQDYSIERISSLPKTSSFSAGCAYVWLGSGKNVQELLKTCQPDNSDPEQTRFTIYISFRGVRRNVEIIPWAVADSTYTAPGPQRGHHSVFVGALDGRLSAHQLAIIMSDMFGPVISVRINSDRDKYPIGSARVVFQEAQAQAAAIAAHVVCVQIPGTDSSPRYLQIDPFLKKEKCCRPSCQAPGELFCRSIDCYRYYCRRCWCYYHKNLSAVGSHKPVKLYKSSK